ncbi:MAG: hypothetical protein BJ554DRAFT_4698 [Olpidium bornovanus]|uniref:Uncharacterized protein n=1 Tax=Olpidium bornovanus TaxID=278681 RepID=A0A8H7ZMB0_9FUNG|nr:MAG: hypothetical protein BJ554DRAFT_4698 [Olpidium bornovanus]
MHEVDCAIITPQEVLQTSGHTEKFVDWVVRDEQTGEILRADHVVAAVLRARLEADREARGDGAKKCKKRKRDETRVLEDDVKRDYEAVLARIDALGGEQLGNVITRLEIKNPETGNVLSKPTQFNLMFETTVGPTGQLKG